MISAVKFLQFWEKVDTTGPGDCWLWTASTNHRGYGKFDKSYAHRFSLEWFVGSPPEGKGWALHACDVKTCVNPAHLRWGTPSENSYEAVSRGRTKKGSQHPLAKLTEEDVRSIRDMYARGDTQNYIALLYGISQSLVSDIVQRKIWKHV
jgi:hypothetical protein